MKDYLARCARVQAAMEKEKIDFFIASPSSDMLYLSGLPFKASERLTLLVLPQTGKPSFLVPFREAHYLARLAEVFHVLPWAASQEPLDLLRGVVGIGEGSTLAVSDQIWGTYLLDLQKRFPDAHFLPGSQLLWPLRMTKGPEEIALLAQASAMADQVFQKVVSLAVEGLTESQLAARMGMFMLEAGFERLDFRIVGSGENGAVAHYFFGERRIGKGDPVLLDWAGAHRGYCADVTRTICVGEPPAEFLKIYEIVRRAQEAAVAAARPGVEGSAVAAAARGIIEEAGYGEYFTHDTGHGIGLDVHERPSINKASRAVLEEGMVFTVEPGIYLPGRFGVRIEDMLVLESQGARRLNQSPRDLIRL